ncbi:rhodanese-like domain-containing protein [Streptomyces tubbatahanensis]|uniref:Rhodanese-like domain-containing protein n=1 Tax=Streptomyces tubbatahanensis TaxID=2923272 RepID=A0ABY3XU97_9ACTN|nr:rhodanese-like domain-containing protein [Streptomyces tubbatahanensis]UNS97960.1 rhodanese-like domain-containing protein [Streptomyces tubbatahanensis]
MNALPGQVPQIDAASVPSEALLLDVREDDEWAAGRAEGALHIPMSEFVARQGELTERLGESERVYVVCRVGGRSAQVAAYLAQQGVAAVNVDGGMLAWESAGRPLVGDNDPAFVA